MSGIRSFNFREGDRSEYLANYLLSGLGLVTAVPRQEDIGFDFYCQLADQESGNLSFGYPFIIQVKSTGIDKISYGNADPEKWKLENLRWLFRLEIPLFIGMIHKKEMKIDIYNTSPLNFIFFQHQNPSLIELILRNDQDKKHLDGIQAEQIEKWPDQKGDGKKYTVDIGNPIVTITNDDISDIDTLRKKKDMLKSVILYEQQSLLYRKLGLPYFYWTFNIETNKEIKPAWMHFILQKENIDSLYATLSTSLISLAINLHTAGRSTEVSSLKPLLQKIPSHLIPNEIRSQFPGVFE